MHRAMPECRRHTAIPLAWLKDPVVRRIRATQNAVIHALLKDAVLADALIVFANWSDARINGSVVAVKVSPVTETIAVAIAETTAEIIAEIAAEIIAEIIAAAITRAIEAGG